MKHATSVEKESPQVRGRTRKASAMIGLIAAALMATLTTAPAQGISPHEPIPNGTALVSYGENWQYWRALNEPNIAWQYSTTDQKWKSGKAPLGYGAEGLATQLDPMTGNAARITYFRHVFDIKSIKSVSRGATLTTIADDGVLVYVNGHEVGRHRVDNNGFPGLSWSYANDPIRTPEARLEPVNFAVPASYLKQGANVISVAVLGNYRSTPDISFDATLTAGFGGQAPAVERPDPSLRLVWSDEFNGNTLNRNFWTPYDLSHFGDGGKQTECLMDRPENLKVAGGNLVITARKEEKKIICNTDDERFPEGRDYTSAHIVSRDKVTFTYGRIEMRAKMPVQQGSSQGLWPAFWLRPNNADLGEIDIMEALGSKPGGDWQAGVVHQTAHRDYSGTPSSGFNYLMPNGASMSDYHTYAVEWTPTEMRWYVDGVLTRRVNPQNLEWYNDAFVGQAFFIRLNMAVGGSWPGNADDSTRFPAEYKIDYVRLYQ